LNLTSIALGGTDPGDYSIPTNTCGSTLAVGSSCTVSVAFAPTATGARPASLIVTSSNATNSPQSTTLSGTGQAAPTFTLSLTPSLTFATQNTGSTSPSQNVTVQNTGTGTIAFSSIALGGADPGDYAIVGNTCGASLTAGGTCTVSITFSPAAAGARPASLVLTDNATSPASPQTVTLSGTGQIPVLTLSFTPAGLSFTTTVIGQTATQIPTQVQNTGNSPITLSNISITGTNAADFAFGAANNCTNGTVLAATAVCNAYITFHPSINGAESANLVFTDNATSPPSPQTVSLSGTGATATFVVTLTPTSLTFPLQNTGTTSAAQNVQIQNTGNSAITISNIALTGANPGDYGLTGNNCPGSLGPGAACSVGVTFSPTTNGTRTASLTFTDTAANSPQNVPINGTGQIITHVLTLSQTSLTFAAQNTGTTSNAQSITIQNTGTGAVTMNGVSLAGTNPGDFAIQSSTCPTGGSTLGVSASCSVNINFSPQAVGTRTASLQIADNANGNPQSVTLTGTGQLPTFLLSFSQTTLTYGSVNTTSNSQQSFNVTDIGTAPVTFTNFAISGANAGDYAITQNNCPSSPATLSAGGSCSITVTFSPTASGTRTANVVLTDNATTPPSPQSIALTGTGVVVTITLNITPSLTFAAQNIGTTSAAKTVSLTANGNTPVVFSGFSLTGANPGDYSINSNTCPSSPTPLAVGGTCNIGITFAPTATGTRTASLSIADNATSGSPQTVPLTGTGQVSTIVLTYNPTSLTFPTVVTGNNSTLGLGVTNTGTAAATIASIALAGTNAADYSITANSCPLTPLTLAAGASCSLSVTFAPTATGTRVASVVVTGNQTGSPQSVPVTGTGQAPNTTITLSANYTFTTPQNVGTTSTTQPTLTITNTGTGTVTFYSMTLGGANPGDFPIILNSCPQPVSTLGAGQSCSVKFQFSPTAAGTRTATLTLVDNATGTPQQWTITGTGQTPVLTVTLTASTTASSINYTTPINTGTTAVNIGYTYITNTGNTTVTISNISFTGTNPSDFALSTSQSCGIAPFTLTAGAQCYYYVNFTPSASGARTANLVVTDTATNSPQSITVSGIGQTPTQVLAFSPTTISNSTPVNVGSTASNIGYTYIENTGNSPMTVTAISITGANASDFALSASTNCTALPFVLGGNGQCYYYINFTPSAAGTRTASLVVTSSASNSPQSVPISAIGQTPTSGLTFSNIPINAGSVSLGTTAVNANYTYITNTGTTAFTITGLAISGTNASDFSLTGASASCAPLPILLNPGANCYTYVNFTPSATGVRTANLVVTDTASGSPHTDAITGTGTTTTSFTAGPASLAFGTQGLTTTSLPKTVNVFNTGATAVALTSVAATGVNPGDFNVTNGCGLSVAAGTSCAITITFSPAAAGARAASLTITPTTGTPLTTSLTGTGAAATFTLSISPASLSYAAQFISTTSAQQTVTVSNTGNSAATFSNIALTGTDAGDYAFSANTCGSVLAQGASCTVSITFTPTAGGARPAALTFTDNFNNSPQNVTISGTGKLSTQTLSISSTGIVFPALNLNTTSAANSVTVTNNGTASVSIGGVSLVGTNPSDFALQNNSTCAGTLAAGAACTIYVTFTPTVVGARAAVIQISDTAAGSPQSVSLNGTGRSLTQTINFSPTYIQFSTLNIGVTSAATESIYNLGTANMTVNTVSIAGANASDFVIVPNQGTCPVGGVTVTPGSSCSLNIAFTPSGVGNRIASLVVTDSASGSPHSVPLIGAGQSLTSYINLSANGIAFGQVNQYATSSAQNFYIYNVGTAPFTVDSLSIIGANAGDFSIDQNQCPMNPATVAAGGSCYIYLQFTPTTTGWETATLQIFNSTGASPQLVDLYGTGAAQTQITDLSPNEINFNTVLLGSSSGATANYFYIYNKGTTPMTFTSMNITGTNSGDFTLGTTTCPSGTATLAAGGSCYVYVVFTPQAVGPRSAVITIADSAPDSGETVSLEGIGQAPATYLTTNPNYLAFAAQILNTTSAGQYFYIYNQGTTAISLTSKTIVGTNAGDFAMGATTCTATIAVNGNCYIYVTFTPSLVGPRSASLQIVDSASGSPHLISLNGIGISSITSLRFNPVNLVYAAQVVGTTSGGVSVQLYNDGDTAFTLNGMTLTGGNSSDFAITGNNCPLNPTSFGVGAVCYVTIAFTPSAAGLRTTNLQVSDTITGSPQLVPIVGQGISTSGQPGVSATLQAYLSNIVFGSQNIGTTSGAVGVLIQNLGSPTSATPNITNTAFSITGTNAADFAISSNGCPSQLNAGGSCNVYITFDPSAVDLRTATLNISGTGATNSPQTVALSGIGQVVTLNPLYLTLTQLVFSPQNVGTTSSAQGFSIYNEGTGPITFSGFSITGANAADFGISLNNCPTTLNPGGGCTINVTFDPSVVGAETASLQIASNAPGSPNMVGLFGTGQAITQQIYLSSSAFTYPTQTVNTTSSAQTFNIYNEGTGTMTFAATNPIVITGTNAGDYSISFNNCGTTLTSGAGCTVSVTFRPSASGLRTAAVQITSSAANSPQIVELSGTGLLSTTTDYLTYSTLSFGTITDGVASSQHLDYLYNSGSSPLTVSALNITGTNSADFSVVSSTCSTPIPAGSYCYFYTVFTPSIVGTETASINVIDSSGNNPTVNLVGTGQAQTQILVPGVTALTFAPVNIGTASTAQYFYIYNYGTNTVTFDPVTPFAISGTNANDFAISQNACASTLAAGSYCYVYFKFTPSIVDVESATVTILDSAGTQTVSLFGTGVTPVSQLLFSQSSINYGAYNVGTTSSQIGVYLQNTGNTTVSLTSIALGGTNAGEFNITSNACGTSLTPTGYCYIYMTFSPTATGQQVANLQATGSAGTQLLSLFGTGQ
jgi:hypothetical protein